MKHGKNMNTLVRKICELEGGKVNIPIAQVKEIMRVARDIMVDDFDYLKVWELYLKRKMRERMK